MISFGPTLLLLFLARLLSTTVVQPRRPMPREVEWWIKAPCWCQGLALCSCFLTLIEIYCNSLFCQWKTCMSVHDYMCYVQSCLTLCDSLDYSPQAPLSMGFFWQEYWNGLPFPSPGDLPNPEINLCLLWLLHCRLILYRMSHRTCHQKAIYEISN